MMAEERKRPLEDDAASPSPAAKRRALATGDGSPMPVPAEGPVDLESFQKEAIYRQMKQYARERDRAEHRVLDLQRQKEASEAALAAIEVTWSRLLDAIQQRVGALADEPPANDVIVKVEELPSVDSLAMALKSEIAERGRMTTALLERFMEERLPDPSPELQDLTKRLKEAREMVHLKEGDLQMIRGQLQDTQLQLDQYREALTSAERKLERSQSMTVLALERKSLAVKNEGQKDSPGMDVDEATPKADLKVEEPEPSTPLTNGHVPHAITADWEVRATERERQLQQAAEERLQLQQEIRKLKDSVSSLSAEQVKESRPYKDLLTEAEGYKERLAACGSTETDLKGKLEHLEQELSEWKTKSEDEMKKWEQELQDTIDRKDHEQKKLRDNRESYLSENTKLKAREVLQTPSTKEFKTLTEALEKRIDVLRSEVKRLRTRLAANAGDEELLDFLTGGLDTSDKEKVSKMLLEAQKELKRLQEQLRHLESGAPSKDVLAKAAKFDSLFGSNSKSTPDVKQLTDVLAAKEAELQAVRVKLKEQETMADSLYDELDQLSTGHDTLLKQNKSKVFELAQMEESYSKLVAEKAKFETLHYSQIRAKEARDKERHLSSQTVKRQAKVIEKTVELEKTLTTQLALQDKELSLQRQTVQRHVDRIQELEGHLKMAERKLKEDERRINELLSKANERERYVERKREEARKAEEEVAIARKEAEKATAKLKMVPAVDPDASPEAKAAAAALDAEIAGSALAILRCSTCKIHFRSHLLIKCMHTFCDHCINDRLSHRQRKCPACNLPFAQSDVQQIFFQ